MSKENKIFKELFESSPVVQMIEKAILSKTDNDFEVLSSENLTECPKKLLLLQGEKKDSSKYYLNKKATQYTVQKWIGILKEIHGLELLSSNYRVVSNDLNLVGNIHGIFEINDSLCAINIHGVDPEEWDAILDRGPSREHILDLMICMHISRIHNGIIIYENRAYPNEFKLFQIFIHNPVIKSIYDKCNELSTHKLQGTEPDKPYNDSNNTECGSCLFKPTCWTGDHDT